MNILACFLLRCVEISQSIENLKCILKTFYVDLFGLIELNSLDCNINFIYIITINTFTLILNPLLALRDPLFIFKNPDRQNIR